MGKVRKQPYTTAELFNIVIGKLKEKGALPSIDYANPDRDKAYVWSEQVDPICRLNFGGSEGIYLDISIIAFERGQKITRPLGTIKTLDHSREAMEAMGKLFGSFVAELNDFIWNNMDDFSWEGYNIKPYYKQSGEPATFSYECGTEEGMQRRLSLLLKDPQWSKVVVTNNRTKEEKVYEAGEEVAS